MSRYSRLTRQFRAQDPYGRTHVISVYTDFIETETLRSPTQTVEGLNELYTEEGHSVNVMEQGKKYQVVQTGVILTSSDPDAV